MYDRPLPPPICHLETIPLRLRPQLSLPPKAPAPIWQLPLIRRLMRPLALNSSPSIPPQPTIQDLHPPLSRLLKAIVLPRLLMP